MNHIQAGAFSENYSALAFKSTWSPVSRRLLRCGIGGEEYFLDMSPIAGVGRGQKLDPTEPLPGSHGWINIEESRLAVYGFSNSESIAGGASCSYVVVNGSERFAIQVDRIMGNVEADPARVRPLPRIASENGIFTDVVRSEDNWLLCADPLRLDPASTIQVPGKLTAKRNFQPEDGMDDDTRISHRLRAVLFTAAGDDRAEQQFVLSISQVQQVMEMPELLTIPGAPGYLLGLVNWRGIPMPVIDLKVRLGISEKAFVPAVDGTRKFVMIARSPGYPELAAIAINQPPRVVPLPFEYSELNQTLSVDPCLTCGIFEADGKPMIVPDMDEILTGHWVARPEQI